MAARFSAATQWRCWAKRSWTKLMTMAARFNAASAQPSGKPRWPLHMDAVDPRHASCRPDFLVISAPKTGSTWLAVNLGRHPDIFVSEPKELKYFDAYCQWFGLNWYFDQFWKGQQQIKGEASPTYTLLPVPAIRALRALLPDLKLIYLMRDPVARAWSHARHSCRFREANFAAYQGDLGSVTDEQWRDNFTHDWTLANGDYLGHLRRWLTVFPRQQVHIGFYESIVREPEVLMRQLFGFLGVNPDVDFGDFPVRDTIMQGLELEMKADHRQFLQTILGERNRELVTYFKEQLNLVPPPEWGETLQSGSVARAPGSGPPGPAAASLASSLAKATQVFRRAWDSDYLTEVLDMDPLAELHVAHEGYKGYKIVHYRRQFYALGQSLGRVESHQLLDERWLVEQQGRGLCLLARSPAEARERIDQMIRPARPTGR